MTGFHRLCLENVFFGLNSLPWTLEYILYSLLMRNAFLVEKSGPFPIEAASKCVKENESEYLQKRTLAAYLPNIIVHCFSAIYETLKAFSILYFSGFLKQMSLKSFPPNKTKQKRKKPAKKAVVISRNIFRSSTNPPSFHSMKGGTCTFQVSEGSYFGYHMRVS